MKRHGISPAFALVEFRNPPKHLLVFISMIALLSASRIAIASESQMPPCGKTYFVENSQASILPYFTPLENGGMLASGFQNRSATGDLHPRWFYLFDRNGEKQFDWIENLGKYTQGNQPVHFNIRWDNQVVIPVFEIANGFSWVKLFFKIFDEAGKITSSNQPFEPKITHMLSLDSNQDRNIYLLQNSNDFISLQRYSPTGLLMWDLPFFRLDPKQTIKQYQWSTITSDGGYLALFQMSVVAGQFSKGNPTDVYPVVYKVSREGKLVWTNEYRSNELKGFTYGNSITEIAGGDYIIVGSGRNSNGDKCSWLARIDKNGNPTWNHEFSGPGNNSARFVAGTNDGGFIVVGDTKVGLGRVSDILVAVFNSDGTKKFQQMIRGSGDDRGYAGLQTEDGGYLVAGMTNSFGAGEDHLWVMKLDSNGNCAVQN